MGMTEKQKERLSPVTTSYVSHFGFDKYKSEPDKRATLVLDARVIKLDGGPADDYNDAKQRQFVVLRTPVAQQLLAEAEAYLAKSPGGHVAFGCGLGRHRSWALASELRRRMESA
jgi:RNase adaptor protein for sRNA GlmZ degradation